MGLRKFSQGVNRGREVAQFRGLAVPVAEQRGNLATFEPRGARRRKRAICHPSPSFGISAASRLRASGGSETVKKSPKRREQFVIQSRRRTAKDLKLRKLR
jgi:hypothetical protein